MRFMILQYIIETGGYYYYLHKFCKLFRTSVFYTYLYEYQAGHDKLLSWMS